MKKYTKVRRPVIGHEDYNATHPYVLHAVRENCRARFKGTFTSAARAAALLHAMEENGTWPEGFDARLTLVGGIHGALGLHWHYVDSWEPATVHVALRPTPHDYYSYSAWLGGVNISAHIAHVYNAYMLAAGIYIDKPGDEALTVTVGGQYFTALSAESFGIGDMAACLEDFCKLPVVAYDENGEVEL